MFTHLSKKNPYHLYKIKDDKIIRDDYRFSFLKPEFQKAEYIRLPNLTTSEIHAIIIELRDDARFKDMVNALYFNTNPHNGSFEKVFKIKNGNYTNRVKDLLNFVKREDKGIYL